MKSFYWEASMPPRDSSQLFQSELYSWDFFKTISYVILGRDLGRTRIIAH